MAIFNEDKLKKLYNVSDDTFNQIKKAAEKKAEYFNERKKDMEKLVKLENRQISELTKQLNQVELARKFFYENLKYSLKTDGAESISEEAKKYLEESSKRIKDLTQTINERRDYINNISDDIDKISEELDSYIESSITKSLLIRKKNLDLNAKAKKAKTQVKKFKTQASNIQEKIDSLDPNSETYEEDKSKLESQLLSANQSKQKYQKEFTSAKATSFIQGAEKVLTPESRQKHFDSQLKNYNDLKDRYLAGDENVTKEMLYEARKQTTNSALLLAVSKAISNTIKTIANQINTQIDNMGKYSAQINARLQGTGKEYEKIINTMGNKLSTSLTISQSLMEENIKTLAELGVSYNIEQRAYIMTAADRVVSTFETTNENLLRLIRIQLADTTAARLGIESTLNEFLNNMFLDSSYLNSMYDAVSSAIFDATASLSRDIGVEFEYVILKWLGSLASVGISLSAVESIATGINYLATGNVSGLSSNSSLQTLMAMAASRANIDYSKVLTKGLEVNELNNLLKSLVKYLLEVTTGSNLVVKQAYAELFNLSISDLKAISNLTALDISNIYDSMYSYTNLVNRADKLIQTISSRSSISSLLDTLYNNFMYTTAAGIATNPVSNLTWKLNQAITSATGGGIVIPLPLFMGSGVNEGLNVNELISAGMVGIGAITSIPKLISSIGSSVLTPGLSMWDSMSSEYTYRGKGLVSNITYSGTSFDYNYVGNSSEEDLVKSSLKSHKESADNAGEIVNADIEQEKTLDDLYNELFVEKTPIKVILAGNESNSPMNVMVSNYGFDSAILKIAYSTGTEY